MCKAKTTISCRITVARLIIPSPNWLQQGFNVPKPHGIHSMRIDLQIPIIKKKIAQQDKLYSPEEKSHCYFNNIFIGFIGSSYPLIL